MHGRHDVLDAHAVVQIGRADGTVLEAVAAPVPRELPLGTGQGIQGLLDGPVTDGVHRALETLPVGTCYKIVKPFLVPIQNAAVLVLRSVGLARVGAYPRASDPVLRACANNRSNWLANACRSRGLKGDGPPVFTPLWRNSSMTWRIVKYS